MTSHYLNQWWLVYRRIYASFGLNDLTRHRKVRYFFLLRYRWWILLLVWCLSRWFPDINLSSKTKYRYDKASTVSIIPELTQLRKNPWQKYVSWQLCSYVAAGSLLAVLLANHKYGLEILVGNRQLFKCGMFWEIYKPLISWSRSE